MNPRLVLGKSINQRLDDIVGFDAFAAFSEEGVFTLCDGANSCPNSGLAAQWLCQKLASQSINVKGRTNLSALVHRLHLEMQQCYPETAATALWVKAGLEGLELSSVGDSSLRVYQRKWAGWGPWFEICSMPRDIDAHGHPSQLIGSEVLNTVHHQFLSARVPLIVLMMSDGPANVLSESRLLGVLRNLGRQSPSSYDLDYLCTNLVNQAFDLGCRDDASVAMIWVHLS